MATTGLPPRRDAPLAAGEPVTTVAIDLGYENPAAFTTMFKRVFGRPPLAYLGMRSERGSDAEAEAGSAFE